MKKRTICIVTGTRAEYGLLFRLMKEIASDSELVLQIVATGMHLSPEFGLTCRLIEQDGFHVDAKVEMLLSSDTPVGIAKSIGLGVIGFADTFERLRPDIIVVLGDRFEILAAVQTALIARIPVAHIHGGELTEGLIDEGIRHSITKMSHLHFTSAEEYARRVVQLGEQPHTVFAVGAPGLDNIVTLPLLGREELAQRIGLPLDRGPVFLVTYHPVTLQEQSWSGIDHLLAALRRHSNATVLITKSNADTEGRTINTRIDEFAQEHSDRVRAFTTMGQLLYLSAMRHADVVIGNSSSGLIEAPFMRTATVNIGERQRGRLRADSVIDCADNEDAISEAVTQALSHEFRAMLPTVQSPYGNGTASSAIHRILKTHPLDNILFKRFYDIPFTL